MDVPVALVPLKRSTRIVSLPRAASTYARSRYCYYQGVATDPTLRNWLNERRERLSAETEPGILERNRMVAQLLPPDISVSALVEELSRWIEGQKDQIHQVSLLLSMHLYWARDPDPLHSPPNAIVAGPTGTGKTYTFRTAARVLSLPFVSVDTTALVQAGIVGLQIEDVVRDLVVDAGEILERAGVPRTKDDDLRLAERGVLFFDEFDKIRVGRDQKGGEFASSQALSVQRRLLKLTEGALVPTGVRSHTNPEAERTVSSAGILIICSGAFDEIDKVRHKRPEALARRPDQRDETVPVDLVNYGFLPELIARLPVLIEYDPLTVDDLVNVLDNDAASPLTVWRNYLGAIGKSLIVTEGAKRKIAERSKELGLGARGLQQVVFSALGGLPSIVDLAPTSPTPLEVELTEQMIP